ncbi:hypothetical protein J6A31_06235 [bacterium]|nr:hypothetical protein [bacterium]
MKRSGKMLVPTPVVTIIFLPSSSIKPFAYLSWYSDAVNNGPNIGNLTCPPWVCPARVKLTSYGTFGNISGVWVSKIIGDLAFSMAK